LEEQGGLSECTGEEKCNASQILILFFSEKNYNIYWMSDVIKEFNF
jgi:hypothetical protein